MKIKLISHYRSLSAEIAEGEYEDNDPRLHGLAKYLLDTGHATAIPSAVIATESSTVESVPLLDDTNPKTKPKRK